MANEHRDQFPVADQYAFMNHAAVAPLCRRAHDAIVAWAADMAHHGDVHGGTWWREIERGRALAAQWIGAHPSEIAFLKNTSEGIAAVAEGFPWQPGDNLVIPAGEYPANVYPWMHLRDRGVEVRIVPCRGVVVDRDDLENAIDKRTRLVSLSYVQFATGYRSDLAAVGELCRRRGVDFCVDAIQGLGVFPIDVVGMAIDYLAADGHKWLVGPEGAAIFYISKNKLDTLRPVSIGWKSVVHALDYSTIDFRLRPDAGRFEGGSYNMPGNLGLIASLDYLAGVGQGVIQQRVRAITDYLVERLTHLGAVVVSPRDASSWSGIVSFELAQSDPLGLVRRLREQKVVISARAGRLRASPHFYNNQEDVDRLIQGIVELRG